MKANSSKIYLVLIFISCVLCEVWVSNNGSDTNGDGSYNSPYKTLAHTFDVINENGAIHLKSGVFIESIETNKMVSLSGEGVNNTTIKGGITFNCASSSTFQNHYLTNLTFEGTSFFIRFTNGVTFQNVSWKGIKFQLNGNLNDSNALIRFEKMTTVKDFKITNCTFSTGSYSNPYGAVFAFYFDGGKIALDNVLIEGYDYQSNFTSQFLLFGNPTEVLLKNSKTLQGGNFYISDSTDVKVHKNVFTNSPLGINNCQNVELYQNIFNNSGDNLVYSSIVDKLEHSGGINLLGETLYSKLDTIQITNNTFSGNVGTSCILINRWRNPPTSSTFSNVKIAYNDFSQIQSTTNPFFIINNHFQQIIINADKNYWGTEDGPKICPIEDNSCSVSNTERKMTRGNIQVDTWFCTSQMENEVDNEKWCKMPKPSPTQNTDDDDSTQEISKNAIILLSITGSTIICFLIIVIIIKKRKKCSLGCLTPYQTIEEENKSDIISLSSQNENSFDSQEERNTSDSGVKTPNIGDEQQDNIKN